MILNTAKSMLLVTIFTLGTLATASAETFTLAPLPYADDALAPVIDQKTMQIHHGKHHQAYVNNLNGQVKNFPDLAELPLEAIMSRISRYNDTVRNNAGGHYNHQLFWQLMAAPGKGGEPSAELQSAIKRDFGSLMALQSAFNLAATTRFGSGWAWLVLDSNNKLVVTSTPNQDNPLMDIVEVQGTPVLALDVWEHAYYLHYQNRRGDYTSAWWQLVNWHKVNELYSSATN